MEGSLGDHVDRLVAAGNKTESREEALKAAIEQAKPKALAAFEVKATEAAGVLADREVPPEINKGVVLRYEERKKFLSSQVVRVPVRGPRISGWILHQSRRSLSYGNALYHPESSWDGGIMLEQEGRLYSFKDDDAIAITSFDQAVEAIGSTNAFTLDRVDDLQGFWEDKIVQATVRAVKGEPYTAL